MPATKYLEVKINGQSVDVSSIEGFDISLNYKLEDKEDFQSKKSSEALGVTFPATKQNDQIANTFHNPGIEDLTNGEVFRGIQPVRIKAGGTELLVGKAFLKSGKHTDVPTEYSYNFYGNNADWMIDMRESTLYDFLQHITFQFIKNNIIASWDYDGTDELLPYVFGPVRYGELMETAPSLVDGKMLEDYNMRPDYMKPALSKYWLIYWGFKSVGYRVVSDFFDSEYFRRQVMPWSWGNFLDSDGTRLDILKFLAKSSQQVGIVSEDFEGLFDALVTNDSTNGGYDNSNVYDYVSDNSMEWTYPTDMHLDFGILDVTFYINIFLSAFATNNSYVTLEVQWYKNSVQDGASTLLLNLTPPAVGRRDANGPYEDSHVFQVDQGDVIKAKLWLHTHDSGLGNVSIIFSVDEFKIDFFRIPMGGTINFENFLGLKKYKFLDFLAGVVDEFNLVIQTDSVNKAVYMEPAHPYSTNNDLSATSGGYFNGNWIDWSAKQDILIESEIENFTDSERELIFKYKDDPNDGQLKKIQDRESNKLALAKYVFPDRFKAEKKEIENRFFSPTMHYDVIQWETAGSEAPQMIIMAPENVSNVSRGEAQNTFLPKSVYYKGTTTAYKWVFDNENTHPYPLMFAVNYKPGGEEDPILSYADESIGDILSPVIGKGLLRRFYLQRLAIMRNGQYYITNFRLNNNDVANFLHREHIICRGQKWELVEINNYKPLKDESTQVLLRKWSPITTT